jgi:hypothetical protein
VQRRVGRQALADVATVAPVLVLTNVEIADATPATGTRPAMGTGRLGSADNRLLTVDCAPLVVVTVVVSFSVVAPVQVAVPVVVTLLGLTVVLMLPVQVTVGSAGAAIAGAAPIVAKAAAHDNAASDCPNRRIISRTSR